MTDPPQQNKYTGMQGSPHMPCRLGGQIRELQLPLKGFPRLKKNLLPGGDFPPSIFRVVTGCRFFNRHDLATHENKYEHSNARMGRACDKRKHNDSVHGKSHHFKNRRHNQPSCWTLSRPPISDQSSRAETLQQQLQMPPLTISRTEMGRAPSLEAWHKCGQTQRRRSQKNRKGLSLRHVKPS